MKEVMEIIRSWDAAGVACAEAILVGTQHSSPRQPGARLVVNEKGEMGGAVSMGCVESDLREHMLGLLRGEGGARMLHYGAAFEASLEVGLSCGGEIDVWIRRHDPATEAWRGVCSLPRDATAILMTRLGGDSEQVLLRAGDAPRPDWAEAAADLRMGGGVKRLAAADGAWFAETLEPDPLLLIVGASPIAAALCALAVRTGFRVALVDPRRHFARAEQFPEAERVVHAWPAEGLTAAGMDGHSYVAVLAHDVKLDVPALAAALQAHCRYIGLLGSRGTQADRRARLAEAGFAPSDLARIHGPIGLKSIGALEPEEIAVAILAELIQVRRGGRPGAGGAP